MRSSWTATLAAGVVLAGGADASAGETLFLDTYKPGTGNVAGPVTTQDPLTAQGLYFVSIDGTFSYANAYNSNRVICGTSEPAPMYPSPGTINGPVIADAETVFGFPVTPPFNTCESSGRELPYHERALQADLGDGVFKHLEPVDGPYSEPRADHTYRYVVQGTGTAVSFSWRLRNSTRDNYGQLRIVLTAATRADCKKRGWKQFTGNDGGLLFKNQGDCVSFFATETRNEPDGPPEHGQHDDDEHGDD